MREAETEDPLLTVEDVALRLRVSKDWVWDHSSRKLPYLPVIRMSDGVLRYRASGIGRVSERAGTGLQFKAQAPVKWGRPLVPSTQKLRNKLESRTKKDGSGHEGGNGMAVFAAPSLT
jgi:hypothetical protein